MNVKNGNFGPTWHRLLRQRLLALYPASCRIRDLTKSRSPFQDRMAQWNGQIQGRVRPDNPDQTDQDTADSKVRQTFRDSILEAQSTLPPIVVFHAFTVCRAAPLLRVTFCPVHLLVGTKHL